MALVSFLWNFKRQEDTNGNLGWGVPFVWAGVWVAITIPWVRREMHKETVTWEEDFGIIPGEKRHKIIDPESNDSDHETKEPNPEP